MATETTETTPIKHLVLIPDGDRRWAKENNLPPWEGHRRGAENLRSILEICRDQGIKTISLWGFSTENWKRDKQEVDTLMAMFIEFLDRYRGMLIENQVRFKQIGRKDRLSQELTSKIADVEQATAGFTKYNLLLCLDYGGRDEIVRASKRLVEAVSKGDFDISELSEESYKKFLDTAEFPDPDYIIRTSGEQRLSGIYPYQGVYAELAFVPENFPAFTKERFVEVLEDFTKRQRRFGGMAK